MKRPELAQTLRRISEGGADEFYKGELSKDILADLEDLGRCCPTSKKVAHGIVSTMIW